MKEPTPMTHNHDLVDALRAPTRALRDAIPETWEGFAAMHRHAVADGALPSRIKELIALAIAAVEGCDGCIAYHSRSAAARGATRDEVVEALGVALLMGGGPVSVHGPRALQAFDEFAMREKYRDAG
jgi:AhpD family alkylhydroperoxidase